MDIVIVVDGSNSIYPWYEVQNFLIKILEKFYMGRGQTQVLDCSQCVRRVLQSGWWTLKHLN
jgi:hypothetical protein